MKVFEILAHRVYNFRVIAEDAHEAELMAQERIIRQPDCGEHVKIDDVVTVQEDTDSE